MLNLEGEAVCWGAGGLRALRPGDGDRRFVGLSGGWAHICGVASDSTAWCWGANLWGQLGDGTRIDRPVPTRVAADGPIVVVSATAVSSCALNPLGQAFCWGSNESGAIGTGTKEERSYVLTPVPVATGKRFRTLDGGWPNCGLTLDGAAWCWGQIPGSFEPSMYRAPGDCRGAYYVWYQGESCYAPTPIATSLRFVDLAGESCGVTADDETYCWGDGTYGQLGHGEALAYSVEPVRVKGMEAFVLLTNGSGHICGLTGLGQAFCWGLNYGCQLGIGVCGFVEGGGISIRAVPTAVQTDERFVVIEAGSGHTCGLTATETVWCWGGGSPVPQQVDLGALLTGRNH